MRVGGVLIVERPQSGGRPRVGRLCSAASAALGSLARASIARGRADPPDGFKLLLCLMRESNFEMLVCLVYASSQRHAARVRPLGSWYALARLLDGRLSCQRHLFAAVSLTSPQSRWRPQNCLPLSIERPQQDACSEAHLATRAVDKRRNDVQRFRDGPVHQRVVRGLRVACRAAGAAARMVGLCARFDGG